MGNVRVKYNRRNGWVHLTNPQNIIYDDNDYTNLLVDMLLPLEYGEAFLLYIQEKYPDNINNFDAKTFLPIYKMQDEILDFCKERKLKAVPDEFLEKKI